MVLEDVSAWVKDFDGHFIMANQSFLNWWNLKDVDQVIGKTDYDLGWKVAGDGVVGCD